ncbi:glycosyltransferase [Rhodococcus sp. CX]|uniref:glycosyltransferase n=1 Tax=Rhodococcus sp. CX TaxID=2789880 RepID=UPI0018CC9DE5|nr:glycosyltransferase [Rhodococcus sp. CX]MBH0122283.1 glycosyltransferase [Rhodococcus sp. CX]
MRVVQVSAHYPPNFISGGTLAPQRLARAVAASGHESYVYAGHLDLNLRPLSTWTERDADVTVRWIVTTPWIGWADPKNSVNPEVEKDFCEWLAEVQPDIVHLHSLQTLGGSLVRAAKNSGARVVVTMHDFWWFCARQFLVSSELRPCSLVVSCGVCSCAVESSWLSERNSVLASHLLAADVILAPSESAARVLRANGVPNAVLEVDENGVPTGELRAGVPVLQSEFDDAQPLRMMFAGGNEVLKGALLLQAAARELSDVSGWSLDMYGTTEPRTNTLPKAVRFLPPYDPAALPEILAEHDVLVLPSIMRESHSILTREALTAGLVVVCSDTLGPEEAVKHGWNGLVVPAADSDALAASLRSLIVDPTSARRMMGRGSASTIRELSDQTAGLIDMYSQLVSTDKRRPESERGSTPESEIAIRRVLFIIGIQGAPLRYRAHLPAEALRLRGIDVDIRHYRDPDLPFLAREFDAIVIYRVPATLQMLDLVRSVRIQNSTVPIVYDVDDLIFDPDLKNEVHGLGSLSESDASLWWHGVARYRTMMETTDMFIGSTPELCRHATEVTGLPSRQFDNGVGILLAQASDAALMTERAKGPLRIGYFSGTTTHDADWASIEPAVAAMMSKFSDLELWLGGHLSPTDALDQYSDRIKRIPFVPWYELPRLLRDVDVCLAPLTANSRFNEAKSAIKWLEAALVETPVVAASTEPFRDAIDHGRTGFLASTTEEWITSLTTLLEDLSVRRYVGSQARREALLRWSPHLQGEIYLANLLDAAELVNREGPRRQSQWVPVADSEYPSASAAFVEPYEVRSDRVWSLRSKFRRSAAARKLENAWGLYRAEGVASVIRKTRAVGAGLIVRLGHRG